MILRTMVPAFGFLFVAAIARAQLTWLPLDDAMKSAQASGHLILLDLRNGASDARGEYLLTYVSPSDKSHREMRRINVEVPGRHATVRATSAYYPR